MYVLGKKVTASILVVAQPIPPPHFKFPQAPLLPFYWHVAEATVVTDLLDEATTRPIAPALLSQILHTR